jgi:predicted transcriptional regulator
MRGLEMKRSVQDLVKAYVKKLSEGDLETLYSRLTERLSGDFEESLNIMQKVPEIDKLLCSAASSDEFYKIIDLVEDQIESEYKKRFQLFTS